MTKDDRFDASDVALGTEIVPPKAREAWNVVVLVGETRTEYNLEAPCELTLGRDAANEIVVDHRSVSRKHARLVLQEGASLEDLGSANGTRADGRLLEPGKRTRLRSGGSAELGDVILIVRAPAPLGTPAEHQHGVHGEMGRAMELADAASRSALSVFIAGASGTGKRWLAGTIHRASPRSSLPLVPLRVTSVTEAQELFGADASKPGVLERAEAGVALLQGVDVLPRPLHQALLDVLSSGVIRREDGSAVPMNARVMSTSSESPVALKSKGLHDPTLLEQLAGMAIELPSLTVRRGELPSLVEHFLAEASPHGLALSEAALGQILIHDWPGNVRELREVCFRAAATAKDGTVTPEDLAIRQKSSRGGPKAPASDERKRIIVALELCAGNQTKAATMLGIARRTLINRIEELDIPRPRKA
jgi:DNA-binding NtrC family response regulator